MKSWKDLTKNDLIYRIKISRHNDSIMEFTTHKYLKTFKYDGFYSIHFFDDMKEHHSSCWNKEDDSHFLMVNISKNNFESYFGIDTSNYNNIEFYSDKYALSKKLTELKNKKSKEIDIINNIFPQL